MRGQKRISQKIHPHALKKVPTYGSRRGRKVRMETEHLIYELRDASRTWYLSVKEFLDGLGVYEC